MVMTDEVRIKGAHYTHLRLWETAKRFLRAGRSEETGSFYPYLATSLFSYLAFEALINAWLQELDPEGWKRERKLGGTLGKCEHLFRLAGATLDKNQPPFLGVQALAKARDFLAHARTEEFEETIPASRLDDPTPVPLRIDYYGSASFAAEAMAHVEGLANTLNEALRSKFDYVAVGSPGGAFYGIDGSWEAGPAEVQ